MADQRYWRHCNKCNKKHPSPTGKKCKGYFSDEFLDYTQLREKDNAHQVPVGVLSGVAAMADGHSPTRREPTNSGLEDRLTRLEDMISQLLVKDSNSGKEHSTLIHLFLPIPKRRLGEIMSATSLNPSGDSAIQSISKKVRWSVLLRV